MKNLFILIAMSIPLLIYSQHTPTKKQINRFCDSINKKPNLILDLSKGISHEKELDSVVKKRDSLIAEYEERIKKLQKENKEFAQIIRELNNIIQTTTTQIDSVSEKQIKYESSFWRGLHLKVGTRTQIDSLENFNINIKLNYELRRWSLGAEITDDRKYYFNIGYKIF